VRHQLIEGSSESELMAALAGLQSDELADIDKSLSPAVQNSPAGAGIRGCLDYQFVSGFYFC